MEDEIIKKFISIYNKCSDPTIGKYSSKKKSFYKDIKKWQENRLISKYSIRPIQFTFEITNKCNCNCKDCGMAANRLDIPRKVIEDDELYKMVDDLDRVGIPSYAITGGEPFLAFDKMCKMINYSRGRLDVVKIISNGFWGKKVEYYFKKLEESGLFENKFFVPTIQISIGEQTVPYEYICNILKYVSDHYTIKELNLGIIHTRENDLDESKLVLLYQTYLKMYGDFPKNRFYLTDSWYVNSSPINEEKIDAPTDTIYNQVAVCENNFQQTIGTFVSPKIFMKCSGDIYPCEIFNHFDEVYLGNYFKDDLDKILDNYNSNKYINFIKDYGTIGFRDVIPRKTLDNNRSETPCFACEFCIKMCEKNNLIR